MTRQLAIAITLATALLVTGCNGGSDTTRMWIGPELVDCEGVAPMMCLQVAYSADAEYELFYDQITGFEPVEGTAYVIDVQITDVQNPPADASSLEYTLVEIVKEN